MLVGVDQKLSSAFVNTLHLGDITVPLPDFVKNFVVLDKTKSMQDFIN